MDDCASSLVAFIGDQAVEFPLVELGLKAKRKS
jgi:hypothetical protein